MPERGSCCRTHQQQATTEGFGVADASKQCLAQCFDIDHLQVPAEVDRGDAQLAAFGAALLVALYKQRGRVQGKAKPRAARLQPGAAQRCSGEAVVMCSNRLLNGMAAALAGGSTPLASSAVTAWWRACCQ